MATSRFASNDRPFWRRDRSGKDCFAVAGHIQLSSAFPEVRAYELAQLRRVLTCWQPDGIQVEFSAEITDEKGVDIYGYEAPAIQALEALHGKTAATVANDDAEWIELRCGYVTTFMRDLRRLLDNWQERVQVTVTVVARSLDSYRNVFQDWPSWVKEGLVDGVCLWFRSADLGAVCRQTAEAKEITQGRCALIAELSCYHASALGTADLLLTAARRARDAGADAVGVYRADAVEAAVLWPVVEEINREINGWEPNQRSDNDG